MVAESAYVTTQCCQMCACVCVGGGRGGASIQRTHEMTWGSEIKNIQLSTIQGAT